MKKYRWFNEFGAIPAGSQEAATVDGVINRKRLAAVMAIAPDGVGERAVEMGLIAAAMSEAPADPFGVVDMQQLATIRQAAVDDVEDMAVLQHVIMTISTLCSEIRLRNALALARAARARAETA